MKLRHVIHIAGGIVALVAVYDLVAPGLSASLPTLPAFPTSNNMTNLLIGGAVFAVPLFF